ncbi:Prephenate dehydrogenase [Heyndrickxia coagulans]|nr:Prephenate dehydrogenase [Heyndrickxia coagulans]
MAGSHKSGVTAASLSLFENAFYLLTPFHEQDQRTEELKQWLKGTKANFITVSPEMHDEMVAVISHFPHVIAASLVHLVKDADAEYPLLKRLAAGGFRDITRIASSNPQMWADISCGNRENLIRLLDRWAENLQEVKKALADNKYELLHRFYAEAKQYRDCLPISGSGAIPSFYDLFVDIPDVPGVVSQITNKLAEKGISITNIRILEAREDIYGVLRISFRSENDRDLAMNLLKKETPHEVYIQ